MKRKFIVVYLDDIMIHSRTLAEHVLHVREVLNLLAEHGLKAKRAKCAWARQKVDFCGFDIDKDGIHAQEHKTRAVMDWPQPENSKDVRGFLGLTSYYRKFIEHYAHIAMPLYTICTPPKGKGDVGRRRGEPKKVFRTPFAWDKECQHAFDTLKKALCNAPVLALPDPKAKYCLHVDASQYALGAVLSQVQGKAEKVLGYFSRKLHDAETRYPTYDRELLGIQDAVLYWKFNLHGAEQPFLVHTDHATLRWILTQPHLTVRQMDILTVLQNFDWEVKHIPGIKNQVADALSRRPDFRRERCNLMALEVTAAGEWIDDIKAGIIEDEWFGPIAHFLADPSQRPPPPTASAKERKLWVSTQRFYLEENGLLWLRGDLEKKEVEKNVRARKKDGEEETRAKEKEEEEVEKNARARKDGEEETRAMKKDEEEETRAKEKEEGEAENNNKRGRLCIPKTMRRRILHEAHDTPAGGHFGADRTYLRMKDRYFWKKMWRDTQRYVAGCDLCHRTNHRSGKPMGLLQPLPIAKGRWQRIGIDFITDLPISGKGHDCIVTFVDHMTKRAHWRACKKTIDAPAFARMFIDDIVRLHGVPQEVVSDRDVRFTADYWREVARILQTKLLMSTAFHPETDGLSENSNKTIVRYLRGFTTHDQANWDDYLPLAEYAYNSSVHRSTKQTPFELDLGYAPPLPLDLIADLQRPQANASAKTLQGREFVERLQRILGVARDQLHDAQDEQTAEANKSRRPIDPAITAGAKVFLDTKDLPITYANVNPTRRKLIHRYIGPYEIL
jgi:transposase InsO family protein